MSTSTTGTGTITLGSAESGYQTFADAGVANADVVRYVIEDTGGAFEIGTGTYTSSGSTLTRTVSESSNSDAAINLSGSATVFIGATAEDIPALYAENESSPTAQPSATGANAIAIGDSAIASGTNSIALGWSQSSGQEGVSIAIDNNTTNYGAKGINSLAMGRLSKAVSTSSIAIGEFASSNSIKASAMGTNAVASGSFAHALTNSYASGADSFAAAITNNTSSYGATGQESVAIGKQAKATNEGALAFGHTTTSTGQFALALGYQSTAAGTQSVAIGRSNQTGGNFALALGYASNASASNSVAIGDTNTASHANAITIGDSVQSTAINQVSIGGTADTVRISESYTLPTSDGTANQVLQTDGSGALSFATVSGGGGGASTVVTKPDAYTVGSSDLGYILVFTGSWNEYATLGSAATLGSGFYVTIINQSGNTHVINRSGSDTFTNNGSSGDTDYKLASGASVTLVSDGTSKWLSKSISPYLYAECNNNSGNFNPVATGSGAVALGRSAAAYGVTSFAAGANSSYGGSTANGSGAVALGGSYASGTDSFAAAIGTNSSSYGATGANSIAIGYQAKATAEYSASFGQSNNVTGAYGAAFGRGNTVSSSGYCFGAENTSSASLAYAFGQKASSSTVGKFAFASSRFSSNGDAQEGKYILRSDTTNATPEALTTTNGAADATNQIILPNNSAYSFSGTIIARESAAAGSDYASWEIKGALLRDANAASTVLGNGIQNKLYATSGASAWAIALTADTTNGGLKIEVTGAASTNIRWVATVNTSEVTYA